MQTIRYPWGVWLSGKPIELVQGKDFSIGTVSISIQIRTRCKRDGIQISVKTKGDRVYISPLPVSGKLIRPTDKALDGYGLTKADWRRMVKNQGGVCKVCGQFPSTLKLDIDHEHVDGWRYMNRSERKKHVRGLICGPCNRFLLTSHMTIERAFQVLKYLRRYEKRKAKSEEGQATLFCVPA